MLKNNGGKIICISIPQVFAAGKEYNRKPVMEFAVMTVAISALVSILSVASCLGDLDRDVTTGSAERSNDDMLSATTTAAAAAGSGTAETPTAYNITANYANHFRLYATTGTSLMNKSTETAMTSSSRDNRNREETEEVQATLFNITTLPTKTTSALRFVAAKHHRHKTGNGSSSSSPEVEISAVETRRRLSADDVISVSAEAHNRHVHGARKPETGSSGLRRHASLPGRDRPLSASEV